MLWKQIATTVLLGQGVGSDFYGKGGLEGVANINMAGRKGKTQKERRTDMTRRKKGKIRKRRGLDKGKGMWKGSRKQGRTCRGNKAREHIVVLSTPREECSMFPRVVHIFPIKTGMAFFFLGYHFGAPLGN